MRNQKGITLIALVITIIVLLILAGVTIAMLSGENGILGRATTTKEANAESTAREQANLALMTVRTEIAAQKVKVGTYNPKANAATLATEIDKELGGKWKPSQGDNTTGTITMIYEDNALNNDSHTLTYVMTLRDASNSSDTNPDARWTTVPTYKQIDN